MLPDTAETSYLNMGNYGKLEDEKSTDEEAEGVQPCFFCAELIHLPTEIILPRHTFFATVSSARTNYVSFIASIGYVGTIASDTR